MSDLEFQCRDCGTYVAWMTSKAGNRYLAQRLDWQGDQYGAQRTYWPAHRCTPDPEYQAARAEQDAQAAAERAARDAARAEREARQEALREAGVTIPTGRIQITGTIISTRGEDTAYGFTVKMLVESDEGWRVWGTMPRSLWASGAMTADGWIETPSAEAGDRVTFTAAVTASDDDSLFGFFSRPTKAQRLEAVAA